MGTSGGPFVTSSDAHLDANAAFNLGCLTSIGGEGRRWGRKSSDRRGFMEKMGFLSLNLSPNGLGRLVSAAINAVISALNIPRRFYQLIYG